MSNALLLDFGGNAVELVIRASALVGIGWLATSAMRKASPAKRSLVWMLCMASLLVLPILYTLLPAFDVPILPPPTGGTASAWMPGPASAADMAQGAPNWSAMALGAYLLVTGLLILRFLAARRALARLWRNSEPADPAWLTLVEDLCVELRLPRRIQLRIAPGPVVPMTWASLAPRLLVPAEARSWPIERRRHVLLHELAHVARFDSLGRSISSIACALYWFHPGVWLAARQLRLEQELAADSHVLAADATAAAPYARSLLELAYELGSGARQPIAATMAGKWQLERRILAMANPAGRGFTGPEAFALWSMAVLASLASALIAPVRSYRALEAPERLTAPTIPFDDFEPSTSARQVRVQRPEPRRSTLSRPAARPADRASRVFVASASPAAVAAGPIPQRPPSTPKAAPPQTVVRAPSSMSYGPQLQPDAPDYRWRLREPPANSARPNPAANGEESANAPAQDASHAPSDEGRSEKRGRPLRISLRIIPVRS